MSNTMNQLDPAEIYSAHHSAGEESPLCSKAPGNFPGQTIKKVSINSKGLKSYKVCSLMRTDE